jgi:endonuclease/exonuclease/phosphatase (EEP) superfamily protein YafD
VKTSIKRLLAALGAATISGAVLFSSCAHPSRVARAPTAAAAHVKVKTYNLNYGLAGEPETLAAIGEGDPDVVFLQETSERWEAFIRREYRARYPYMKFHHCCGAGGLGVISKHRFEEKDYLEGPEGSWFPALRVIVDSPIGALQVLTVHLHPPATESGSFVKGYFTTDAIREAEMKAFFAHLDPSLPTLIVGDFNEPDGDAVRFLQDQGLRTGLPEFAPRKKTWRWKLPVGSITSRLDHIVYNDLLEPLNVEVLEAGNSDHLPVVAIFERAQIPAQKIEKVELTPQRSPGTLSFSP